MFSAIASRQIAQAATGRSRHTVPASSSRALVGTGRPGRITSAPNNHHGCSRRNASERIQPSFSIATSTPICQASASAPNPSTNPTPASR